MTEFTRAVLDVIAAIPRGRVMTYGDVAAAAGSPGAARGVVWILHSSSDAARLPWHRVVGKDGRISLDVAVGGDHQRAALEAEGVVCGMDGRVDMKRSGYKGGESAGTRRPRKG